MIKILLPLVILICSSATALAQRLYVVGVPSEMDAATGKSVLNATLDLVLRADEGSRIQVFDALNLQKVIDVTIPTLPGKSNPKVRVVRLKKQIGALKNYFTRSSSVRSGKATHIKVPQFLELAGSALKSSSGDTTVLLFGSPYYSDARDVAFVFGGGFYPSDGHILSTSKRSVFGTSDKKDLLKGVTIHFCHLKDVFDTELERTAVSRFWKIYCDSLGAVLATFVTSTEVAVERALNNAKDAVSQDRLNPKDTVIEMRKTVVHRNPETVPVDTDREDTPRGDTSPERSEPIPRTATRLVDRRVQTVLRSVPKPKPGSLVIAAVWVAEGNAGKADVDLYVRPHPEAGELNFRHRSSAEGKYLRDIRSARKSLNDETWGASWEAVEMEAVHLENATCWLNLYRGCGGKIEGVVRVVFDGRTADVPFTFPPIAGDEAAGHIKRAGNACWIEVALHELRRTRAR